MLEARQRRRPLVLRVVDVHENVRARLDLVPGARFHFQHVGAAAGAGDDRARNAGLLEQSLHLEDVLRGPLDRCMALFHGAHVLRAAVIGLQAGKAEIFRSVDGASELQCGRTGRDAAAAHADFELDVDIELRPARLERREVVRMIDADPDMRALREGGEARDLRRADHFVADQHIGDAALDQCFGLGDLLAAHADGAVLELALRDLGALVCLGVRPHAHRAALHRFRKCAQIALEGVELEHERRGVDLLDALAHLGRRPVHAAAVLRERSCAANQTRATATIAISGSANRLTRSQPAVVTATPELNEETSIIRKIAWSFAPCALARSSGR